MGHSLMYGGGGNGGKMCSHQPPTTNHERTNEDDKESGTTDRYQYSVSVTLRYVLLYDFISFIIIRREMLAVLRTTYDSTIPNRTILLLILCTYL